MYILDTCILNILFFYPGAKRDAVTRRLREVSRDDVFISAISVYELIGVGAVPEINRNINSARAAVKLEALSKLVSNLSRFNILPFTEEDHRNFELLPAAIKRKGPMDARIAASALSREQSVVVTEDTEVFELTGLRVEDWTRTPT